MATKNTLFLAARPWPPKIWPYFRLIFSGGQEQPKISLRPPKMPVALVVLIASAQNRSGVLYSSSMVLAISRRVLYIFPLRYTILLRCVVKRPDPLGLKCDTITSSRRLVNTFLTSNSTEFR
jgi:hypothetical protein